MKIYLADTIQRDYLNHIAKVGGAMALRILFCHHKKQNRHYKMVDL